MQNSSVSTTATATPYVSAAAAKPVSPTPTTSSGSPAAPGTPPAIDGRDRLEISSLARKLDVLRRAEEDRKVRGVGAEDTPAAAGQGHAPGGAEARPLHAVDERLMHAAATEAEAEETDSARQQTELARLRRLHEEAQARGEELSVFERERLGRLERIELLVQEGRYSIEPAMMDLLAIRLAKFMISPHA